MTKRIAVGLVALLCVALLVGAVGCGDSGSSGSGSPEQVVKDFWSAFKKGDFDKAKTYLSSDIADEAFGDMEDLEDPTTAAMVEGLMDMMDLEIKGSTIDGDEASVDVVLTMPDMEAVMEDMMTAMFSSIDEEDMLNMTEEQMAEEFAKVLPELLKNAPTITEEDEMPLVKEDGNWKIVASPFEDLDAGF